MMVAADLMRRGYKIAFPYGEDWDYDLIVCTAEAIDWLAVYDACSECCYYVLAELGDGMCMLQLRLTDPKNNQRTGIRFASDYVEI